MNKKVAVLMTDMVEDIEYTSPKEAIEAAGYETVIVSPNGGTVKGKNGGEFESDVKVSDANPEDYVGILIPGGFSPDGLRGDKDDLPAKFASHFLENDKPVFTICHGPQLLVDTGKLKGRTMTAVKNVKNDVINAGAEFKDESVVVDKNLVSSRTPDDLDDFNREIKNQLK